MEPKLTNEEAKGAWNATFHLHAKSFEEYCADLLKRGLIAPEPDKRKAAFQAYLDRLEPGCAGVDMEFTFYAGYNAAEHDAPQREAQPALTREIELKAFERAYDAVRGTNADMCRTSRAAYQLCCNAVNTLRLTALTQPPHADKGVG